LHVETRETKHT